MRIYYDSNGKIWHAIREAHNFIPSGTGVFSILVVPERPANRALLANVERALFAPAPNHYTCPGGVLTRDGSAVSYATDADLDAIISKGGDTATLAALLKELR